MITYPCSVCGKRYKRLGYLRRHRLACELLYRSKTIQDAEQEEMKDCPSRAEMWKLLKIQGEKIDKLEKEMHSLKQMGFRAQKKMNVIEWLNQQVKPKLSYSKWKETFALSEKHLKMIFVGGYINGFINILQSVFLMGAGEERPLYAFQHKKNILYYFDGEKWQLMPDDVFKEWLDSLYSKELMTYFKIWYIQNQNKLASLDSPPIYQKNLQKILGEGKSMEERTQSIKKGFYKQLKVPFTY